jgi:hypothetical protein
MILRWKSWDVIDPEKYYGFVYGITNEVTGKYYIGKKVFWNNKKKKLTKKQLAEQTGPGRKPTFEVVRTESDWKTYWGSNKQLLADVKQYGEDNFTCWIYRQCSTKKQLTYYEMHYQCKYECLTNPKMSYNDNILGKFFTKDLIEAK